MRGGLGRTIVAGVLVAAVAAGYLLFFAPPIVPETAASDVIVHIDAEPGEVEGVAEGDILPPSLMYGSDCLARIERPPGWADLCWVVYELTDGVDPRAEPGKDYFALEISGSFAHTSGAPTLRWLVLEARLQGEPAEAAFDGWPDGTYTAPCGQVAVTMMAPMGPSNLAEICGRTTGGVAAAPRSYRTTWTCDPCLPLDDTTRAIALYTQVAVPDGTTPVWDLYADLGG